MNVHTETWFSIFSDPNHIIAELLWTLLQDGFIGWFMYGFVWKRVVLPKIRKDIHEEIDQEHGIEHEDETA